MPDLGEEFRRAREARGLSISDVADRLHIRGVYLSAIEDENWTAIGAPVYVRGFMRTYARFLGLDPEGTVARLAEQPAPGAARSAAATTDERAAGRRGLSPVAVAGILVALLLVGYVGYQYAGYRAEAGGTPAAAASGEAAATPAEEAATPLPPAEASAGHPAAPAAATSARAGALKDKLIVRLSAPSWLRIEVDGRTVLEGTFPAGTLKSFGGKTAFVRVGNAAGVEIIAGGRPAGNLGATGDVVERRFVLSSR